MKRLKKLVKSEEMDVILEWLRTLNTRSPSMTGLVLDRKNSDYRNFWTWAKKEGVEASSEEVAETIERLIKEGKIHLVLTNEGPISFSL